MANFIKIFAVFAALLLLQVFLSNRESKYPGMIIPSINLVLSVGIAALFSDYFSAFLYLTMVMIPLILWVVVYKICRKNLEKRRRDELERIRILDL